MRAALTMALTRALLVAGTCILGRERAQPSFAGGDDDLGYLLAIGDEYIYGMLEADIVNNAYGPVQTHGFTSKLKVNGTVNIGIGDHLTTNNVAGIARKSAANNTIFAMALEAYAGADNLGVIDALIFAARHE